MEVNFRPESALGCLRIHLITILPEGSGSQAFERLFAGLKGIPHDDSRRTGQEEITGITLKEWVGRVHQEGGVCIAAHVDNSQGVRRLFRQTAVGALKLFSDDADPALEDAHDVAQDLKDYLFQSEIDAVEVRKASDGPHYRWICKHDGRERWIPTLLSLDSHSIEAIGNKDRVTHIKMTSLGIAGLKGALKFPDTRIRFPDNLPSPPSPRILGIEIKGGKDSFFQDVTIALTDNLNCLIGARGSGKSTVVEALRYVFGYNRTLKELDKLEKAVRDTQIANLTDCVIRVIYCTTTGDERVLEATFDPKDDYTTKVFTTLGEFLDVADVENNGEFPLRLFGWSEIETLGRSPARQRDLLDRLIPDLGLILRKRSEIRTQLKSNRAAIAKAIVELNAAFARNNAEIERFTEFKADFDKLNTAEVKTLFSALDLAQAKRRVLTQVQSNLESLSARLGDPSAFTVRHGVESLLENADQELRDWWLGAELPRLGIVDAEQDVQRAIRLALERLAVLGSLVEQHVLSLTTESDGLQRQLRDGFSTDASKLKAADLRANAEQRLNRVTALRKDYLHCWDALHALLNRRNGIADDLVSVQNQIAGIRSQHNTTVEQTLNHFFSGQLRVSIDFRAGGDTDEYEKSAKKLMAGAKRYQARELNRLVGRSCSPVALARMLRSGQLGVLVGKKLKSGDGESEFTDDDAQAIRLKTNPFEHNEHAQVDVLAENGGRLEALLDLDEVEWDDYEAILLDGRPVNEKSPGQRSSAMLPLIALAERTPLVIDQPEDNLDKKLIGNVLVTILSELKEQRQIIVCTHDPNILVGGDAEQVVVLEAESDRRSKVALHGSIDNDDVVQVVVDILEGGAEAFITRRKRYGDRVGIPH